MQDEKYSEFQRSIEKAAAEFSKLDKKQTIAIVSHLDADGICAASLLIALLNRKNIRHDLRIVSQLSDKSIEAIAKDGHQTIFFTDIGSGKIKEISQKLAGKRIFTLDHHEMSAADVNTAGSEIIHVNPHLHGIDGGREISGSGVVYLFAKEIEPEMSKMSYIAVIGAIGDVQEEKGFKHLNNKILQEAIEQGKIKTITSLRVFGAQTRPLHKVLEFSNDPYIPGVTGSESGAIQFLHHLKISPKNGNDWKKLIHLEDDEMARLVTGIVVKRLGENNPEDVLGPVYLLADEKEESSMKDAKEFSTLLNACGRLDRASVGIGICLGDKKARKKVNELVADYKKEITKAMEWYHANKKAGKVLQHKNYVIINAGSSINYTMIGTIASMLSKSGQFRPNTLVISLARCAEDGTTKVSLRISGKKPDVDLREIVKEIVAHVGGEAGGHKLAAGAIIPIEKEDEFIEKAKEVLEKIKQATNTGIEEKNPEFI